MVFLRLGQLHEKVLEFQIPRPAQHGFIKELQGPFHAAGQGGDFRWGFVAPHQVEVQFLGAGGLLALIGLDAAGQVIDFLEAEAGEHLGRHPAAAANGAMNDGGLFRVQGFIGVGQFRQRQEFAPGDMGLFVFPGLADVQDEIIAFLMLGDVIPGFVGFHGLYRGKELNDLNHFYSFDELLAQAKACGYKR